MSPPSARRNRIIVIVIVLGSLLVAALVDGSGSSSTSPAEQLVALGPRLPAAHAEATAWYCAEGTSNPGGRADERLIIANVDRGRRTGPVTVMQGPSQPAPVEDLDVAPGSLVVVRVADILAVAEPGVLVEVTGGRSIVTHSVDGHRGRRLRAVRAGRRRASWHFAAGTTVKGAQQYLALFNPFAEDAIVDIQFLTDSGPLGPEDLQGFVVPAHSRVTVPVQDQARRHDARRHAGQHAPGPGRRRAVPDCSTAPTAARAWRSRSAARSSRGTGSSRTRSVVPGRTQMMVIANPSSLPTTRSGQDPSRRRRARAGDGEPARPAPRSSVDLGRRVPPGVGFSVAVESRLPVVAESLVAVQAPIATVQRGIATTIGAAQWARRLGRRPGARATSTSQDLGRGPQSERSGLDVPRLACAGRRRAVGAALGRARPAGARQARGARPRELGASPSATVVRRGDRAGRGRAGVRRDARHHDGRCRPRPRRLTTTFVTWSCASASRCVLLLVAVVVAVVLERRRKAAAGPVRDPYPVPRQLYRADFPTPGRRRGSSRSSRRAPATPARRCARR